MNEDIIKDLIRMRELLNINEQSPDQSITEILKSNDVVRIKEFLLQKPDLQKKLEELFNLEEKTKPIIEVPLPENLVVKDHSEVRSLDDSFAEVERITHTLPKISELEELEETELDDLAKKAETAYDDLMDLGMNVEVRYSSRIFEVASSMLGHAITAKSNKIEKKLKAIDLQMKKYKIDKDSGTDPNEVINGQGYVITDRNELLKKLSGKA